MHTLWKYLRAYLFPDRNHPPPGDRNEALWFVLIAVAISLAAGPEFYLALEMLILLELLGAALFMTAFGVGAKYAIFQLTEFAMNTFAPAPHVAVIRGNGRCVDKAIAANFIATHCVWASGVVVVAVVSVVTVLRFLL